MTRTSAIDQLPRSLRGYLDKPIAFHRIFAEVAGSITAGLLLSQAVYWTGTKTAVERDGWFYKTQSEWAKETGLTRREQESARKKLRELGMLEEERRGIPAKLYFRVNLDRLSELILGDGCHPSMAESAILDCTKAPYSSGGKRHTITETTQENTNKDHSAPHAARVDDVSPEDSPSIQTGTATQSKVNQNEEACAPPAAEPTEGKQALAIVRAMETWTGVIPVNYGLTVKRAAVLVKAGLAVPEAHALYDWLAGQSWRTTGVDIKTMIDNVDKWRAATGGVVATAKLNPYEARIERELVAEREVHGMPRPERNEARVRSILRSAAYDGVEVDLDDYCWDVYPDGYKSKHYAKQVRNIRG